MHIQEQKMDVPATTHRQEVIGRNYSFLSISCSIWTVNGLDNAHPHWRGQSTLLSPNSQMLILPGNILTICVTCYESALSPADPMNVMSTNSCPQQTCSISIDSCSFRRLPMAFLWTKTSSYLISHFCCCLLFFQELFSFPKNPAFT